MEKSIMNRIEVDLEVVKSLSDKIFTSGYTESNSKQSIVGYRHDILSIAVTCGGDKNSIHFMSPNVSKDFELRALLSEEYHKRGLYIDFTSQGERDVYARVYSY
jgi:hypothetical protein